jgi:IclR family transcriptional regulator, acetate operon repressor
MTVSPSRSKSVRSQRANACESSTGSRIITDPDQLIADLRRVRERGYALDKGETSLLATCIAAPVLDAQQHHAIAAISISGPTSRFNPRRDSPVVEGLLKATAEISEQLRSRAAGKVRV